MCDALDFGAGSGDGRLKVFFTGFVFEKAHGVGDAAQWQAFGAVGLGFRADDEFRRAATDVDDEHAVAVGRQGVDDAGVDEAGFFAPGDDFDGKAQCGFGLRDEGGDVFGDAEGVGGNGADLLGGETAQAFAEFGEAGEGALLRGFVEVFLFVQTGGKAHHFFDGIDDLELAVVVLADLQAEAVGTEIDGGEHLRGVGVVHADGGWGKTERRHCIANQNGKSTALLRLAVLPILSAACCLVSFLF